MILEGIDKFEYKFESFRGLTASKKLENLNKLGLDGWELVFIDSDNVTSKIYVFKRKITTYTK